MIDSIVAFIVVLGVLVFIHELGHFLLAKKHKVKVGVFSLGFGPKLVGYRYGETEYRISLIPLGGYVKLSGEDPNDPATGAAWELSSKSILQRFSIFAAGPAMNIILAIMINIVIAIIGLKVPIFYDQPAELVWVRPEGQAEKAGLQPGDRIIKIGTKDIATWEDVQKTLRPDVTAEQQLLVQRGDQQLAIKYQPIINQQTTFAELDFGAQVQILVGSVTKDSPADLGGLKEGDVFLQVNGLPIREAYTVQNQVLTSEGRPVEIVIERDSAQQTLSITPRYQDDAAKWLIGISFGERIEYTYRKLALPSALAYGFTETASWTKDLFGFLGKLVTGQAPLKSLGGPVLIAQVAGAAWREGVTSLLYLMAFLSLNLAVINLLPIPMLDGGHILFLIPELFTRKPVNERIRIIAHQIGFAFLMALIGVIFYIDLTR